MKAWICLVLFRVALPLTLLIASAVRFNLFSFVYGCLMLAAPLLQRPTHKSLRSHTGRYLTACLIICSITLISQVIFQIYINTGDRGIGNCSETEMILHHFGLQKLNSDILTSASIIVPDIAAFVICLLVFISCHLLLRKQPISLDSAKPFTSRLWPPRCCPLLFDYFAKFVTLVFMTLAGILHPSIIASVYFLFVLLSLTVWSVFIRLRQCWFQRLRFVLLVYAGLHLVTLYVVQFHYAQSIWMTYVERNGTTERLLGLTQFLDVDCASDNVVGVKLDLPWMEYVYVLVIVFFYFILAWELRRCRRKTVDGRILNKSKSRDQTTVKKDDSLPRERLDSAPNVSFISSRSYSPADGSVVITYGHDQDDEELNQQRSVGTTIGLYLMKQSYIGTLIIMMAWSIAYHSWLTFIFLLGACFIWILPKKQTVCFRCSPLIVFYAICLLILQYIYSFNLTDDELPVTMSYKYRLQEIGLVKYSNPAIPLGIKVGFTCMFWLTLRQFFWQRCLRNKDLKDIQLKIVSAKLGDKDGETITAVGRWLRHKLCKYWILACAALFLFIALQEAVIFRIVYMALFLAFVILLQVSYHFWRICMYTFWVIVIIYSMVVLGCIYTYQFEGFPALWQNNTGMSEEMLANLGLRKFDTATLFVQLLTPTSFLIIIIMQLHYFQKIFLSISDLNRFKSKSEQGEHLETVDPTEAALCDNLSVSRKLSVRRPNSRRRHGVVKHTWKDRIQVLIVFLWTRFLKYADEFSSVIWRFLEIHIFKFVVITIFLCCVLEVNVLNTVLVLMVVILLPFERTHQAMSVFCLIWSSAVLLLKMVYQLDTIPLDLMSSNCTVSSLPNSDVQVNSSITVSLTDGPEVKSVGFNFPFNFTIDSSRFFGLQRKDDLARYLMIYVTVVLMLALEAIVKYHQIQYYNHPERKRPIPGIMFADVKYGYADSGLKECFMFLANYTFYKFGKELCFIATMITMVVRLDIFSVLYGIFLGILLLLKRSSCRVIWPVYMTVLVFFLVLQYLSCLGMPPALCWEYPWSAKWVISTNLKTYLFLPSYTYSPQSHKLIADFVQLLLVCLQQRVFCLEKEKCKEYGGGDNNSVIRDVESGTPNPKECDFTSYKNSYLDYLKMFVFFWSFWLTLLIVLISGMSRISLFCMGYLIGCFVFLWFGEEMLLKPRRKLIKMWMGLLFYCFIVLLCKCCLQLIGCVYPISASSPYCWIIQLLNIVCLQSAYYEQPIPSKTACKMSQDEAGLSWDAVCFVFLLFMVRVFKSWYFQHVVTELTVRNSLAARGAELINESLLREVERLQRQEEQVLDKIKMKMARIRERHHKCLQKNSETVEEPTDHYTVIRSGDYYMFEDVKDDEEDMEEMDFPTDAAVTVEACDEIDGLTDTPDWRAKKPSIGPIAMINAALLGGTKEALNLAGGRTSMFASQTGRRSSSAREYTTPDFELPPSSPFLSVHEYTSPPGTLTNTNAQLQTPLSKGPEAITSAPAEQRNGSPDISDANASPRKCFAVPSDTIAPVTEEVLSEGEDDVFDGKDKVEKQDAVVSGFNFVWVFTGSVLDSLISFLYKLSSNYRSISRMLEAEKQQEKLRIQNDPMHLCSSEGDQNEVVDSGCSAKRLSDVLLRTGNRNRFDANIIELKSKEKAFHSQMPRMLRLLIAISDALMSRTDLLCYFVMVLNVLLSASILSILFPISIFFWGMLSVPRPTKTYWITIITYTEAIIVLKYLFQFNFFPWNLGHMPKVQPYICIIGIEKKENYAALDFFLLFCLFLHRMVLKSHGLWKDAKGRNADLFDVEVKYSSQPGSPQSSQIKSDKNLVGSPSVAKGTMPESPKPSHENILKDPGAGPDGSNDERGSDQMNKESRGKALCQRLFRPVYEFFSHMINPKYSAVSDVYAFMFACDLVTFLIVVFGYSSFGPTSVEGADVATVLQQSRVPVPFLAMLLVQFVLIIIDRALYLRKLVFGKFLFHIFLVILVHIWMFFVLPAVTDRAFTNNVAAQLWYFIKCVYFALSCYQIRSGYPTRILGNFLTKNYNYVNLFCFKGFLAVPFLLELRALMDWMWTDTTLALTSWLQMEDIYANIFVLKCWRRAEAKYPTPRGLPRSAVVKYGLGGIILIVLVFIIWFPLLLFSLSGSIFNANPPVVVDVEMKISGYESIFSMIAQHNNIEKFTATQYDKLRESYQNNVRAQAFLMNYRDEDVYEVKIRGTSASTWEISYPSERHLYDMLAHSDRVTFLTVFTVRREPTSGSLSVPTVIGSFETTLSHAKPEEKRIMQTLAQMINGSHHLNVTIPNMFPRYITVPSQKRLNESGALSNNSATWSPIVLSLHQDPVRKTRWWQVKELVPSTTNQADSSVETGDKTLGVQHSSYNSYLTIITFNERIPTGVFSVLNNYGIIGIYVSVVLVLGRFVRLWSQGLMMRIMFEELPNPDPIWMLCNNIYLAREALQYKLEEELVSKLIFIFRSPELLLRITRHKTAKTKID